MRFTAKRAAIAEPGVAARGDEAAEGDVRAYGDITVGQGRLFTQVVLDWQA